MRAVIDRRDVLLWAATVAAAALRPRSASGQDRVKTKLILLGTGGGPRPRKTRSQPAQVVLVNDTPYVVDCGNGVARQLVFAGVPLPKLRHIFITHHHSDHNADYGNLIGFAWTASATTLKQSIVSHHTTAEDAGRVAQAAGVKTLVLSHFMPSEDPAVTDQMWIDAARTHFRGTVIMGKDLLEI